MPDRNAVVAMVSASLACCGSYDLPEFTDCDRCGQAVKFDDLDYKPTRYDRWWWYLLPWTWAADLLLLTTIDEKRDGEAYGGYCGWCFGPGYKLDRESSDV